MSWPTILVMFSPGLLLLGTLEIARLFQSRRARGAVLRGSTTAPRVRVERDGCPHQPVPLTRSQTRLIGEGIRAGWAAQGAVKKYR